MIDAMEMKSLVDRFNDAERAARVAQDEYLDAKYELEEKLFGKCYQLQPRLVESVEKNWIGNRPPKR